MVYAKFKFSKLILLTILRIYVSSKVFTETYLVIFWPTKVASDIETDEINEKKCSQQFLIMIII